MVKYLIDFFLAIGILLPQFLGLAINHLQLLQHELHTTNTGFIMSLIRKLGLEGTPKTLELWESVVSADSDLILRQKAWNRSVEP